MNLDCARCGAQLQLESDSEIATCPYCGSTKFIDRDGDGRPSTPSPATGRKAGKSGAYVGLAVGLFVFVLVAAGGAFAWLQESMERAEVPDEQAQQPAEPEPDSVVTKPLEEPPAQVVSRKQLRKILEPEVLACMQEHKVHYLITRVGQGYDAPKGLYPPLTIVHGSVVDYRDVDAEVFNTSPLGVCILEAASQIWADAPRGAYVHFGLRNPHAPDPLAGKPRRLNTAKARHALAELDDAARECGRRQLEGFKPGRDLSMLVEFTGIDGKVSDVDPNYIPRDSAYGKCIRETYASATVPKFRDLSAKIVHKLRF